MESFRERMGEKDDLNLEPMNISKGLLGGEFDDINVDERLKNLQLRTDDLLDSLKEYKEGTAEWDEIKNELADVSKRMNELDKIRNELDKIKEEERLKISN
jgi:hypothetical protein